MCARAGISVPHGRIDNNVSAPALRMRSMNGGKQGLCYQVPAACLCAVVDVLYSYYPTRTPSGSDPRPSPGGRGHGRDRRLTVGFVSLPGRSSVVMIRQGGPGATSGSLISPHTSGSPPLDLCGMQARPACGSAAFISCAPISLPPARPPARRQRLSPAAQAQSPDGARAGVVSARGTVPAAGAPKRSGARYHWYHHA